MSTSAYFEFHPIGQGAFYTCRIYSHDLHKEFNIVYDCGVQGDNANLLESVKNYKRGLHNKKIDALFISHLDEDHVNGIKNLLDGVTCGKIFLPYLTPEQRLYELFCNDSSKLGDDYISFLTNPIDYLTTIGGEGKSIFYVTDNTPELFVPTDNNNEDDEVTVNLENVAENTFTTAMTELIRKNNKINFKRGNNTIGLKSWEFYVYFQKPNTYDDIEKLKGKIENIYQITLGEILSQDELGRILNDATKLKELRKEFKNIFKCTNKSSLVVLHRPNNYTKATFHRYFHYSFHEHYFNSRLKEKYFNQNILKNDYAKSKNWGTTLLTGDISLKQIEDSAYIKGNLEKVLVFQVPHHGSATGWDSAYLRKLNYKGLTSAIINFGYGNTYGHPKPQVLSDLENDNFDICFCNQFEGFSYMIHLD